MSLTKQAKPSKNILMVGYGLLILVFWLLLEFASYVIEKNYFPGVFFDKSLITQPYDQYLKVRNAKLGWLPRATDGYGARVDTSEFSETKPCVDVYGDSFTWGGEVEDNFAWPTLLSSELQCRVRNYGVSGYGSDQAFLRFLETENSSRIVVINHLSENIIRNVNQFRNFIYPGSEYVFKPRFVADGGVLKLVDMPVIGNKDLKVFLSNPGLFLHNEYFLPEGGAGVQKLQFSYALNLMHAFKHWHVKAKLKNESRHAQFYDADHPSNGLMVTENVLRGFYDAAKSRRLTPIVTVMPTCLDFQDYERTGRFPYKNLTDNLEANGIPVLDLGKEIWNEVGTRYKNLYITCSGHFNELGNQFVAKKFGDYLVGKKLLKVSGGDLK